jgi:hypothetical protein
MIRTIATIATTAAALAASGVLAGTAAAAEPTAVGVPEVTTSVPPAGPTGWYTEPTTVTVTVRADRLLPDSYSRAETATASVDGGLSIGDNPVTTIGEGRNVLSWSAVGRNDTVSGAKVLDVDLTDPTVAITSPQRSRKYLVGTEVRAEYSCADAVSGLASCTGDEASGSLVDTSKPGHKFFTVVARDVAGRLVERDVEYDVVTADTVPPVVDGALLTGTPGEAGWYRSDVVYRVGAADQPGDDQVVSGLDRLHTDVDGVVTDVTTGSRDVDVRGDGRHVVRWSATDRAGNASEVRSVDIGIDTTPPTVGVSYPTDGQVLDPTSSPTPRFVCDDATSGVATCGSGSETLDLTPGVHTLTVDAVDVAGNAIAHDTVYEVAATAPHPVVGSRTSLTAVRASAHRRGQARVRVVASYAVRGKVVVLDGSRRIGTATVGPRGRTTVRLPRLQRGVHRLRAVYLGAPDVRRSTSPVRVVHVRR